MDLLVPVYSSIGRVFSRQAQVPPHTATVSSGAVTLQLLWHPAWLTSPAERTQLQHFHLAWRAGLSKLISSNWKLYRCIFAFMCTKFFSPVYLWLELLKLSKVPVFINTALCKKNQTRWWTFLLSTCELLLSVESGGKFLCISMRPGHHLTHLKLYFMESNKNTLISGLQGAQIVPGFFEHFHS